jgi:hypothetical protein
MKIDKTWFWLFFGPVFLFVKFTVPACAEAVFAARTACKNEGAGCGGGYEC